MIRKRNPAIVVATDLGLDPKVRAWLLYQIRIKFRGRHAKTWDPYATAQKRLRTASIRVHVAELRQLGPGPVEPMESCGGEVVVPEIQWP